jgi:hypothetical protein
VRRSANWSGADEIGRASWDEAQVLNGAQIVGFRPKSIIMLDNGSLMTSTGKRSTIRFRRVADAQHQAGTDEEIPAASAAIDRAYTGAASL